MIFFKLKNSFFICTEFSRFSFIFYFVDQLKYSLHLTAALFCCLCYTAKITYFL